MVHEQTFAALHHQNVVGVVIARTSLRASERFAPQQGKQIFWGCSFCVKRVGMPNSKALSLRRHVACKLQRNSEAKWIDPSFHLYLLHFTQAVVTASLRILITY